eukprot:SM000117S25484  [mRNA]  locus=s117:145753:147355:+ [translate_table: standard]
MARLAGLRAVLTAAQRRRRQLADAADGALQVRLAAQASCVVGMSVSGAAAAKAAAVPALLTLAADADVCQAWEGRQQQREELGALAGRADDARSALCRARAGLAEQSAVLELSRAALLCRLHSAAAAAQSLPAAKSRLQVAAKLLEGPGGQGQYMGLRYCLACRRAAMVGMLNRILPLPPPALVGADNAASAPSDATLNGLSGRSHKHSTHTQVEPAEVEEQLPVKAEERVQALDRLALQRGKALAEHLPASQLWPTVTGDKQQQEAIATALGYVAHTFATLHHSFVIQNLMRLQIVVHIASYLGEPLRYRLQPRASRSVVVDPSPRPPPDDAPSLTSRSSTPPPKDWLEFALYQEGQDLTRFAYAIFLLNKDLEQLLSTLDRSPVGPRHTLPNVHCLVESIIQLPKALLDEKE